MEKYEGLKQLSPEERFAKREEEFIEDRPFKKLIGLKLFLNDSIANRIQTSGWNVSYYAELIKDPMTYAYSSLGFSLQERNLDPKLVETKLAEYLKEKKKEIITGIDEIIPEFKAYEVSSGINFHRAISLLEEMRDAVWEGDWDTYGKKGEQFKVLVYGMLEFVRNFVGQEPEQDSAKEMLEKL